MIKVKDGYAKLIGTTYAGSADRILLSNGGDKAVSDFATSNHTHPYIPINSSSSPQGGIGWGQYIFRQNISEEKNYASENGAPVDIQHRTQFKVMRASDTWALTFGVKEGLGWIDCVANNIGYGDIYLNPTGQHVIVGNYGGMSAIFGRSNRDEKLIIFGKQYTSSTIESGSGFIKSGSSDSYVLLGGGGHKLISAFSMTHDHPYLPLSGGTMFNTNKVTNLNADLLDGYHASSFYQNKTLRSDQDSIYDLRFNYGQYDKGDFNGTYKDEYPTYYGSYIALTARDKNMGALMFFDTPTSNNLGHIYISTRGAGNWNTTYSEWGTLAYITDNVASSSKWANARTITLTGSVTGSVSIDGSANVTLATTTTHTHTFASLNDKPTTISGYGITDGLRRVTLANNVENDFDTFENLTLTGRGDPTTGSSILNSPWITQPAGGFGALTYLWSSYGLQLTVGYNSNDIYIRNKYYHDGGSNWSTKWDKILNSSNYNSYTPKLDGTGATGTWGISISGNAASSTQSLLLSSTSDAKAALGVYFHRDNGITSLVGNTEGNGVWGHPGDSQDARYGNSSILRIGWNSAYYTDIFTGPNLASGKYGLQWRQIINRTAKDWRTILDSSNYNSYCPKLDGTGATGTWSISITGNAATATNADKLDGHKNGDVTARYFNSLLLTKTNTLDNISDGVYCWINADNPTNSVGDNSALLQVSGRKYDRFQLAFPGNNNGRIFFRNSTYQSANALMWNGWKQLSFTSDIPTKISQLTNDSGYVTSSGVTSVATGTGLTGGTITSTGTISINSTYQTYISHGESAYNSLSNYILKKPDTHFYNYIGCNKRSNWYKITLPFHNITSTNNRWMMVSMELILKGNYSNGADGTIYLSYYIHYLANNNVGIAEKVYAVAIGSNMNNVRIAYNKANLGIFYVYVPNNYNSFAIQNLSANDTASLYDFTTTTIDALASSAYPVDSEIQDINIRKLYTTDGTSLMLNGNVLIDAGNIGNQNVNSANTSNRTKFLETFQQNSTTTTYGAQYPIWAQWSDATNVRLKCTNYTVWTDKADNAINADKLDGQHGSRYTSALGGSNYVTFTVEGDANTYYPVVITNTSNYYPMQLVNISRAYHETAPDTWNTSTHRGGLTLTLLWNGSRYWDGNTSGGACYCVYHTESYSTMVGGLGNSTGGKVVWLRGGGAVYHIHSMNGTSTTVTVYTSTYTDSASQSFAPKTSPEGITVRWPGYADGADYASSAGSVAWANITEKPFNWSGQSGQPSWLWGSNDGTNYYVWDPSNFNVNYANSAGNASTALLLGLNTNPANTVATAVGNWTPFGNKVYVYRQRWTNSAVGSDTADLSIYLDGNLTANMCLDGYYFSLLGFKKDGSSDSYVLLGGGGHKLESNLSVNYATSAGRLNLTSCYNGTTNNDLWSTIKSSNSSYLGTATIYEVYNDGGPDTYGEVLDIVSVHNNHWQPQLWFGSGKSGRLKYRNKEYNDNSWGDWRTVAWTSDIPSVGNGTVTVTQAGSTIGSFTMNQSGNTLIALTDNNTHYTTKIYAGASGTATNTETTNPYLKVTDNNTYRNQVQFKGSGYTTVSSNDAGVITISSINTWRDITDSVSTTSSTISGSATAIKTAYDKAVSAYNLANSKTSNKGTVTSVATGTGLTGGIITTSGTISLATSGVTSGSYGPEYDVTGNNGNTILVPYITVDAYGRITSISNKTYTAKNTTYTFTNKGASLSWGTTSTIATVGGVDIKVTMPSNPNTNTTYTFESGNNCFYVTPSGGSKQTVTVNSSISNNITGSGASGYLAKFDGTNTITKGPQLGSGTSAFLRNDGIWATPPNNNYYHTRLHSTGLRISSGEGVNDLYVPYATDSQDGVVTITTQTFKGQKTFLNGIKIGSSSSDQSTDNTKIYFGDGSYVWIGEASEDDSMMLHCGSSDKINFQVGSIVEAYVSNAGVYSIEGFFETSDERLKNILKPVKINLDDLSKLRKIYYTWKDIKSSNKL